MLEVTIHGSSQTLPEGLTILAALRRLGIVVPSLCHDQGLRPPSEACTEAHFDTVMEGGLRCQSWGWLL